MHFDAISQELATYPYQDSKGYFIITPPMSWKIKEFPDDPRGKVQFSGPSNTSIGVLVNIVNFDFDHMIDQFRKKEETVGPTNIQEDTFIGLRAVRRSLVARGMRFDYIDFLVNNVSYNLYYGAPVEDFDTYHDIASCSLATIIPSNLGGGQEEMKQHILAKKKTMDHLMKKNEWETVEDALHGAPIISESDVDSLEEAETSAMDYSSAKTVALLSAQNQGGTNSPKNDVSNDVSDDSQAKYALRLFFAVTFPFLIAVCIGVLIFLWFDHKWNLRLHIDRKEIPPAWIPERILCLINLSAEKEIKAKKYKILYPDDFEISCQKCGKLLRVPVRYAGTFGKCKDCGNKIAVPTSGKCRSTRFNLTNNQSDLEYLMSVNIDPDKPLPLIFRGDDPDPMAISPITQSNRNSNEVSPALGCLGLIISAVIAGPFAPIVYVLFVGPMLSRFSDRD